MNMNNKKSKRDLFRNKTCTFFQVQNKHKMYLKLDLIINLNQGHINFDYIIEAIAQPITLFHWFVSNKLLS